MIPHIVQIHQDDTHRLIPAAYSEDSVLERLAENEAQLEVLAELEGATNDRLLGEANALPGISVHELLFGVRFAHVVNAAFTHPHPMGSRFNGSDRGAWYAAFDLETAQTEVAFHKARELEEIGWRQPETFVFDDYLADFRGEFHDIRRARGFAACLDAGSYKASQELARELLAEASAGIVYPSVRHRSGICLACFRPALVLNVRKGAGVTMRFEDYQSAPEIRSRSKRR